MYTAGRMNQEALEALPPLPPGVAVVCDALAEDPAEAIEHHLHLRPQEAPAALGPGDVLVAVRSAAVNWVDLIMTSGQYQHQAQPPYTPGLEYAGVVAWAGSAVREVRVGDAVFADGFLTGPRSAGGYQRQGGFASYAVAPAAALRPLPRGLGFDQACNLLGNYETALHCLSICGRLQEGETALILGASGGTGLAAVHVARLLGATVIAVGRSADKLAIVAAEGAHHTVTFTDGEALRASVKALTGGRGVDLVYDGVGGALSVDALRTLRFGGRHLIVGWASTPAVARGRGLRGAPNANQLPTNLILMKGLQVLGCPTVLATQNDPALRAPRLAQVLAWVEDGRLRPRVARAYALADFREAMRAKWQSLEVGGIVLHPPQQRGSVGDAQ